MAENLFKTPADDFIVGAEPPAPGEPPLLSRVWKRFLAQIETLGARQTANVTLGNADGEIGGLTISNPPTQAEVQALRDKCEELADDLRNMHQAFQDSDLMKGS